MRLSSHYMFQRSIESMSNAMNSGNKIYTSLAAGRTLLKPSDDPAGASQAITLQSALSTLDQYDTARSYAQDALGQQDTVLNSISSLLSKNLMEKIVAAESDSYSAADRKALATELEGIRNSLRDLANSKNSNGRYIFSGYATATKPFNEDGTWNGADKAMSQTVADGTTITVGHTGKELFMTGSDNDIFAALNNAINVLNDDQLSNSERHDKLEGANAVILKGIDNLGKIQAEVGTCLQQLDTLASNAAEQRIQIQTRLEQTVGADPDTWTRLVGQSKMADFAMTASVMLPTY
ncbi:flagellar hook-associated protein FlgL [[Erwinia] mediterraneensis]|uniref:flagellar hook-associated protein FlgL n=1 Tax=[Erwinia] mediterraneensis TaxID=2161819 RepID=UPI0010319B9B|nr:flagellar hook-associated protein FlgL [[Erwinia] mediterraneensis]